MGLKHCKTQQYRVAGHIRHKGMTESEIAPPIRRSRRSGQDEQTHVSFD